MKNVCLIGNSHLAAIKLAADAMKDDLAAQGYHFDTFAAHRKELLETTIVDNVIHPDSATVAEKFEWTSGGQKTINLDNYQEIYVVFGSNPFDMLNYAQEGALLPLSPELIEHIFNGWMQSPGAEFLVRLAERSDLPIGFLGHPFRSENAPEARALTAYMDSHPAAAIRPETVRRHVERLAQENLPANVELLFPPCECLNQDRRFTLDEFCRGSARLTRRSKLHEDSKYGP